MSFYFKGVPKGIKTSYKTVPIKCRNCTYFISTGSQDYCGKQKFLFNNNTLNDTFDKAVNDSSIEYLLPTEICRLNHNLCGPEANNFKPNVNLMVIK